MTASEIQELAENASTGDEAAFESLYLSFYTPIYRYVLAQTRHRETAEDITQSVFIKIFSSLKENAASPASFRAYVYAMSRNAVIDHQRKKKDLLPSDAPLEESFREVAAPSTDLHLDQAADEQTLFSLLETASPLEQEIISLHFFADLPHRTIAEILGRSETSVRQIQSRALKKLRSLAPQFFI